MFKRLAYIIGLAGILGNANAQEQLIREGSAELRRTVIQSILPEPDRKLTLQRADSLQLDARMIYPDGRIMAIRSFNPNLKPEYLSTDNIMAARTVSTDKLWLGGGEGFNLDGAGMVIGVWDGGVHLSTHVEFGDRALVMDPSAEVVGHATHVSGTLGAAGLNAQAKGMAGKVILEGYDWDQDLQEMEAAGSQGLLLSNHSYGFVNGWDYNIDEERWEWWGDLSVSEEEDYQFGFYHREAHDYDRIARRHPYYLIVKSAGNDRGEGPSAGTEHYVWQNGRWTASTQVREKDGGEDGFDSMGPVSTAKNILSVGAVWDMPLGYTGREDVKLTSYSAFGPTDDGRIKPDLVANGDRLYSSYSGGDDDYQIRSGTSMSAPNVTGSLALIQQHHWNLFGKHLTSAGLKGLVLHTADDAGNPGPDYKYGWGLLNTHAAVRLISDESYDAVQESVIMEGEEQRIMLYSSGNEPIKISICWTDYEGFVPEPSLDPIKRILMNDLDIRLVRQIDGRVIHPYILDPLHPANVATRGDNVLDNVEQIFEATPLTGFYEVIVSHKGVLTGESQDFSLVISGLTDEYFASGLTELTDNNGEFKLTSASEYLPDMDASWLLEPENGLPVKLYFEFFNTEAQNDILSIYDGPDENAPLIMQLNGDPDVTALEINSSSGQLFLRFLSDSMNQERGFSAIYCTVNPADSALIQGEINPCTASQELYLAAGVPGVEYLWTAPSGWVVDSLISGGVYLTIGEGVATLRVQVSNRCGSGPESEIDLTPLANVPLIATYTADTLPCAGVTSFVEVDSVRGTVYDWNLPVDWLGSSSTHKLEYIPGYNSGAIYLEASNACGYGDTLRIPIRVQTKPGEVQILTSRDKPCALSTQEFHLMPSEGFTYFWETIDDWSILGPADEDTVSVSVGAESSFLFVTANNKCGSRKSGKLYITSPLPEQPRLALKDSEYEGYRLISVFNFSRFSDFQWYLNSKAFETSQSNAYECVAYLPGIYTVGVSNAEGCVVLQEAAEGIEINQENQVFNIYPGRKGILVVVNNTSAPATVNIYDFSGKIQLIQSVDPGYNEIVFVREGAFIVSVRGSSHSNTSRIFSY